VFREHSSEVAKVLLMLVKVVDQLLGCLFLHDPPHDHLLLRLLRRRAPSKRGRQKDDPHRGQQDVSILAPFLRCSDDSLAVVSGQRLGVHRYGRPT
jgi:hypothetical protein